MSQPEKARCSPEGGLGTRCWWGSGQPAPKDPAGSEVRQRAGAGAGQTRASALGNTHRLMWERETTEGWAGEGTRGSSGEGRGMGDHGLCPHPPTPGLPGCPSLSLPGCTLTLCVHSHYLHMGVHRSVR